MHNTEPMFEHTTIDYDTIYQNAGSWISHGAFMEAPTPDMAALVADMSTAYAAAQAAEAAAYQHFKTLSSHIWERIQAQSGFAGAAEEYARTYRNHWDAVRAAREVEVAAAERARARKRADLAGTALARVAAEEVVKGTRRHMSELEERLERLVEANIPRDLSFDGTDRLERVLKMHLRKVLAEMSRGAVAPALAPALALAPN